MGCYYMAILSYFTRFTMKRGNAGSWNFGWKRSKHWKPILHCSKSPETPQNLFLDLLRIIERKKYIRGPTPYPGASGGPRGSARLPPTQTELDKGCDTSILHHAFISIFIALWAVIKHYISILMAILSYFTRFTMKRGNAGYWNSDWKRSKHWKPILHCSKSPGTP